MYTICSRPCLTFGGVRNLPHVMTQHATFINLMKVMKYQLPKYQLPNHQKCCHDPKISQLVKLQDTIVWHDNKYDCTLVALVLLQF